MAVIASDIKLYAPLENPANDTDELGGGIDATAEITNTSLGELLPKRGANALGGADIEAYGKCFVKNTNAVDDLYNAVVWIDNGLISPAATGVLTAQSSSALDDSNKYLKFIFELVDGTYTSENVSMNGTTLVTSAGQAASGTTLKVELREQVGISPASSDPLIAASGDISIYRGTLLGKIPAGYSTASGYFSIALEDSLDDTKTTDNRLTCPLDDSATPLELVFDVVNTKTGGIAVANGGELTADTAQGVWIKQTLPDGSLSSSKIEFLLRIEGEDS